MKAGDRVTGQRATWHDGAPVAGWPSPHYIGTVVRRNDHHGSAYVVVRFDSGRQESVRCDSLTIIPGNRQS